MKKGIFVPLTLLFVSNIFFAQIITLDSITDYRDMEKTIKTSTKKFLYNDKGFLVADSTIEIGNKVTLKTKYRYDNDKIKIIDYFGSGGGDLEKNLTKEFIYNSKGNDTLIITNFFSTESQSRVVIEERKFLPNNKLKQRKIISKAANNNSWKMEFVYEYDYKNNGEINYINETIDSIKQYRENYFYNVNGKNIQRVTSSYDPETNTYIKDLTSDFTFDNIGNETASIHKSYDDDGTSRIRYKVTDNFYYNYMNKDVFTPFTKTSKNINLIESRLLESPDSNEELTIDEIYVYHYSFISKVEDFKQLSLSIFPNPTQTEIYIKDLEIQDNSIAQLISTDGRLSFPRKTSNNSIDVKGIPSGTYTLLIQDKDVIYRAKFMKL